LSENLPAALHWRTLLITAALGLTIYVLRRGNGSKSAQGRARQAGLVKYFLPKDIYFHLSARVDIWLWIVERCLRPFWFVGLLVSVGPWVEKGLIAALTAGFGATPGLSPNYGWMLLYSLLVLLFYDFFFYTIHYCMHKVPAFWAVHKVHHSAEVLTPLTRTREHFIAGPVWATGAALGYAIPGAIFAYLFNAALNQATLFGVGVFAFVFGLTGNFRHYHIALHYPRWLCFWLQSPAMHHTHHSYLTKHWDTNLGAVTSIFDRVVGTLYIPEKDEYTPWGLGPESQAEYRTFAQNTFAPFKDWYAMWVRKGSPLLMPDETEDDEFTQA